MNKVTLKNIFQCNASHDGNKNQISLIFTGNPKDKDTTTCAHWTQARIPQTTTGISPEI